MGGGEDDDLGLLCVEELTDGHGIQQVQLGVRAPDELGEAAGLELAPDGRAYEAAMSRDVDLGTRVELGLHRYSALWPLRT